MYNQGELNLLQSDLPGTSSAKCSIKNLKYLLGNNSRFVDQATVTKLANPHKSKFGAERTSSTHVKIWDKVDDCD